MAKRPITLVAVACAAACAIPLALPLFAGASLAVVGATLAKPALGLIVCGALALLALSLLWLSRLSKAKKQHSGASCSTDGACGCRPTSPLKGRNGS